MRKIWMVRYEKCKAGKGEAEILIEGGKMSYERSTVIGRLFKKHLSDEDFDKYFAALEEAVRGLNEESK